LRNMLLEPREEVADLEGEIDRLLEMVERCRKVAIVAKVLTIAGALFLILALLGLIGSTVFILAIAAALGGVATWGSNQRTRNDALAKMRALDAKRSEIIDQLDLQRTHGVADRKSLVEEERPPARVASTETHAPIHIEKEGPEHWKEVDALTREAFRGDYEADLADRLRREGLVIGAFVALADDAVIGHIMLSDLPTEVDGRNVKAACLAPLSVSAMYRQHGIGARLIGRGINALRERGYEVLFVLGDPSYYTRFGFSSA
jgi:predicted N-acetyltransferase YhbS